MDISLTGKVALVTGTGPNIGSGVALMLAKYGARVACNDIRSEAADAAVSRIERNGGEAMAIPGDVANEDEVKAYVQKVLDAWGRIDILINSAAVDGGASVLDFELDRWTLQLTTNCTGNFLNTKWAGRSMVERGIRGSIVCMASTAGWQGRVNSIGYCTSKGGIVNFVRAAALDLAPYGIRVNSYTPIATGIGNQGGVSPQATPRPNAGGQDDQQYRTGGSSDFAAMIPMGELPTPIDHGHVIAFLCSDYARLITGTDFRADGGGQAKFWAYAPPAEKLGPLPLIKMDMTEM